MAPGEWTDDTSMALALADSIASVGWDLNDQARRYLAWLHRAEYSVNNECFDIGGTTLGALLRFEKTGNAKASGDRSERASGNGSIMRLAPVPIRYAHLFPDQLEELVRLLVESSLPTHASPQCLSACAYIGLVLAALIEGIDRQEVLADDWEPFERLKQIYNVHPEVAEVAAGRFRRKRPPEIVGSGYVVKSLEAALWAFHDAKHFREAVLRAVNLGDDADTTGAVCGQLAAPTGRVGDSGRMAGRIGSQGHDRTTIEKAAEGIGMSKKRAAMVAKKEVDNPKPQRPLVHAGGLHHRGPVSEKFLKRNPEISRTIQIRGDQTLKDLHHAIFDAFDRFDEHLFEFQIGKGPNDPKGKRYVPCTAQARERMSLARWETRPSVHWA